MLHTFASCLVGAALVAPIQPRNAIQRPAAARTRSSIMIQIAKKDKFGDFEQDLLGQLGIGKEEESDVELEATEEAATAPSAEKKMPTPRSGRHPLFRWSHEDDAIEFDFTLPEGTRAQDADL